jgi:hypothetical protein
MTQENSELLVDVVGEAINKRDNIKFRDGYWRKAEGIEERVLHALK